MTTDDTTLQTDEQLTTDEQPTDEQINEQDIDPNKRTFFGGEVNFKDTDTFKAVDDEQQVEDEQQETHWTENLSTSGIQEEETKEEKSWPIPEQVDEKMFDPFEEEKNEASNNGTSWQGGATLSVTKGSRGLTEEEPICTCTEECASGYNPNCTCECEECNCREPKEETAENPTKPHIENPLIDKFLHLVATAKNIFSISEDKQSFNILWNKNDKSILEYFIYLVEDEEDHTDLFIKKVETNTITDVENEHMLQRSYTTTTQTLDIFVDEILVYQFPSSINTTEIISKLEKFWFLFETHYENLNKALQEKKEAETKKKQLHEIFRNF